MMLLANSFNWLCVTTADGRLTQIVCCWHKQVVVVQYQLLVHPAEKVGGPTSSGGQ